MRREDNISKCGNFCDLCPAYLGQLGTAEDRQKGSAVWERCFGLHFKPERIKCQGCQCSQPWKTGNTLPSRMCAVRACANYNEVPNCAYCAVFPCPHLITHVPGGDLRQKQEELLGTHFSEVEYQAYIEPYEGRPHLAKIRSALSPEQIKTPKTPINTRNPVVFPSKTILAAAEEQALRKLHSVLSQLLSQKCSTYVEQLALERRQPVVLALLWVLALYGQPGDQGLLIDSAVCQDKKECTRLVRKSDNQLHGSPREAVTTLAGRGLRVDFTPRPKGWQLSLDIDALAGGKQALAPLQLYVKSLAGQFGVPVYAGSYDLKGRAFKIFSRLDLSVLRAAK
jgi:hypothetical protein